MQMQMLWLIKYIERPPYKRYLNTTICDRLEDIVKKKEKYWIIVELSSGEK